MTKKEKDLSNVIEMVVIPNIRDRYLYALEQKKKYEDNHQDLFMSYHYGESSAYKNVLDDLEKLLKGWKKANGV